MIYYLGDLNKDERLLKIDLIETESENATHCLTSTQFSSAPTALH